MENLKWTQVFAITGVFSTLVRLRLGRLARYKIDLIGDDTLSIRYPRYNITLK